MEAQGDRMVHQKVPWPDGQKQRVAAVINRLQPARQPDVAVVGPGG